MAVSKPGVSAAALSESVIRFLRQYPPFSQMEDDALQFLVSHVGLGYYPKGTVILDTGQPSPQAFHIIQRGTVQVLPFNAAHSFDAHPVHMGPGECFSVSAMLENRPVIAPYTAVADTFCYELSAEHFPELLNRSPVFREFTTEFLASMLRESRRLIKLNYDATSGEQQTMSRTLRSLITRYPVTCSADTSLGDVLRTLLLATYLLEVKRVLVMPHTDCRMASGTEEQIHQALFDASGFDTRSIEIRTVTDQVAALKEDVASIQNYPLLPKDLEVVGAIFDVKSGELRKVV